MRDKMRRNSTAGFTLIETLVSIVVLAVGVLGLAAMLAASMAYMTTSKDDYIAQQKAAEAVESIFTARNAGQKTWNSICNIGSPICPTGIFTAAPTQLCDPGADGILGTADDNCAILDSLLDAGTGRQTGNGGRREDAADEFYADHRDRPLPDALICGKSRSPLPTQRRNSADYTLVTNISRFS